MRENREQQLGTQAEKIHTLAAEVIQLQKECSATLCLNFSPASRSYKTAPTNGRLNAPNYTSKNRIWNSNFKLRNRCLKIVSSN